MSPMSAAKKKIQKVSFFSIGGLFSMSADPSTIENNNYDLILAHSMIETSPYNYKLSISQVLQVEQKVLTWDSHHQLPNGKSIFWRKSTKSDM